MHTLLLRNARFVFLTALVAGFCLSAPLRAQDVIEIEEYWTLAVGGPDEGQSAPQVTMVMSPTADLNSKFFVVNLNHWNFPQFEPGGIQVQRWSYGECVESTEHTCLQPLHHDGETLSWVQRMRIDNGTLTFEIVDGSSDSWGSFGNSCDLRIQQSTSLTRLNDYSPGVSISESGIGFAGNRVSSLVLQKLRWTTADGEVHEMVAPIDIDADIDP